MGQERITAAVIALNEEAAIEECLRSLDWADERLVVDGGSADATACRAGAAGARVVTRPFDSFARQRNHALQLVQTDWVLFVDADERVDETLAAEIRRVTRSPGEHDPAGYWVPRRNLMLGRWVRHAGWWPDFQLRLLRPAAAHYDEDRDPHEVVLVDGDTGHLSAPLLHFNYRTVAEMFDRQERYARRAASNLARLGTRPRLRRFLGGPLREFWRRYVTLQGYRDGALGFLLGLLMAWYEWRVQVHLLRTHGT